LAHDRESSENSLGIFALNPDGSLRWNLPLTDYVSDVMVDPLNTQLITHSTDTLDHAGFVLSSSAQDGHELWRVILPLEDQRWGEPPHAFVVLKQGARADERELLEFARANLAHFKAPHSVTFVKELPKTATGKIQKYILRAQRTVIAPQ
jgi:AMP-binding enzyme